MKQEDFEKVHYFLQSYRQNSSGINCRLILKQTLEKFHDLSSQDALISIVLQWYSKIIRNENSNRRSPDFFYRRYLERVKDSDTNNSKGFIINLMALELNLPPSLVAKQVLQAYLITKCNPEVLKSETNRLLRNPFDIDDLRLSIEIRSSLLEDAACSPVVSIIRELIGVEKEVILTEAITKLNFPFKNEVDLKSLGFDKTPDIKFEIPVCVDGNLITWIESKALFGCCNTHRDYWKKQYGCYKSRFGPGLVIYWFGFVDDIAKEALQDGVIVKDHFPNITKFYGFKKS